MSYGMHDYLTEKAMQRNYMMQKYAADEVGGDNLIKNILSNTPANTAVNALTAKLRRNAELDKELLSESIKRPVPVGKVTSNSSVFNGDPQRSALGMLRDRVVSRSRAFLAEHPEILYGLGGAGIGAGIGALVSPKRRLLGSLIGLGLGGAIAAGGKMAWDRYGLGDLISVGNGAIKWNSDAAAATKGRIRDDYNMVRYGTPISPDAVGEDR